MGTGAEYIFLQAWGTAATERETGKLNKLMAAATFTPSFTPSHGELGAARLPLSSSPFSPPSPTSNWEG